MLAMIDAVSERLITQAQEKNKKFIEFFKLFNRLLKDVG
jgi:hypothetical protein